MNARLHVAWLALATCLSVACTEVDASAPEAAATAGGGGDAPAVLSSSTGGAGGESAVGAAGQAGTGDDCWVLKPYSPDGCGACAWSLEQYCSITTCQVESLPSCEGLPDAYSIDEGCGYLRLRMRGHGTAIYSETIYDIETQSVVYYYDNGGRSAGCMPELTVGTSPTCEAWTTLCEGLGGA